MLRKDYPLFLYLRADAVSNFTSNELKSWYRSNITLTLAGPKHQEQNVFVGRDHGTSSRISIYMLVRDHLPILFMPAKNESITS